MSSSASLYTSMAWFVAVIALIPLVLWLMKRMQVGAGTLGRPGVPRTVAVLPLSAQNKVVTVEVGHGDERVWLVLGVGPQGTRTLHTMSAQDDAAPVAPQAPSATFAQLLGRIKGRGQDGH